jgi:hypothetical protein
MISFIAQFLAGVPTNISGEVHCVPFFRVGRIADRDWEAALPATSPD